MIENSLVYCGGKAGKLFIISGVRRPPGNFSSGISEEPEEFWENFTLNKKKCLTEKLQSQLDKTQMSTSFYIFNSHHINMVPLYAISKLTNGELKHYFPQNHIQFYYDFSHALCQETADMGTEAVLKVRHSTGLKLVGIFGQYRNYRGSSDQVELLSCPSTRSYMF